MKKIFPLSALIFLISGACYVYGEEAVSAGTFFDLKEKKAVLEGEIITGVFRNTGTGGRKAAVPKTRFTREDYPAYEIVITEKAFIPYTLNGSAAVRLFNNLAAYSKLSGTCYYSVTDKKVETLILRSTRVEDSVKLTPLRDNVYGGVRGETISYFKIEDNRFGDTVFKSRIYSEGDNFIVKNISTHPLKKFGFTVNESGEYHFTFFFLYDKDAKGYFYYAAQALRVRSVYFQKLGIVSSESFANRLRAMTVYFAGLMGRDWRGRLRVSLN